MSTKSKKDRKLLFVIYLIAGIAALYLFDMIVLAWRL